MKIALLHYASVPVIGGVEQVMAAHAKLFAARGHEVVIVSQRGDASVRLVRDSHVESYTEALRPVLRECDVVIVHNVMTMPFDLPLTESLARLAIDLPDVRFIGWVHDIAACNPDLAPVAKELGRHRKNFSYVAVSPLRARQFAETTGVNCAVIPNGIDPIAVLALPDPVARFARQHCLLDGRTIILHPTRLLRRKNVELGLEVIRVWKTAGHRGALLVTGAEDSYNAVSGEYADWLRQECARLEIDQDVLFVGAHFPVGDAELAALYRLSDALFLPSRHEGFGLPVLESALHRVPTFISDLEPLRSVAGPGAWRFSLECPAEELAQWMLNCLEGDARHMERRRVLTEFSWAAIDDAHLVPLLGTGS